MNVRQFRRGNPEYLLRVHNEGKTLEEEEKKGKAVKKGK